MRLTGDTGVKPIFDQLDSGITSIFYTGIAPTSSLRLTMRWTMDMVVRPGTVYAPFVRVPPVEDHLALQMYADVSRRLQDCYPSMHNNLAALLPIIGKVAKAVLPTLGSFLPDMIK